MKLFVIKIRAIWHIIIGFDFILITSTDFHKEGNDVHIHRHTPYTTMQDSAICCFAAENLEKEFVDELVNKINNIKRP